MLGFGGFAITAYSHTPPYTYPIYHSDLDESLNKLDEELKNLKELMLEHLEDRREYYKNAYDPNSTLMKILTPTIVVPMAYYFFKGCYYENLSSNRSAQCLTLMKVVEAIGTNDDLGKKFIASTLSKLFTTLESGNSISLMRILLAIYCTSLKTGGLGINIIDAYKTKQGYDNNFDLKQYLIWYKESAAKVLNESQLLTHSLENIVSSYIAAPKV